jgi:hypothetical protein
MVRPVHGVAWLGLRTRVAVIASWRQIVNAGSKGLDYKIAAYGGEEQGEDNKLGVREAANVFELTSWHSLHPSLRPWVIARGDKHEFTPINDKLGKVGAATTRSGGNHRTGDGLVIVYI